MTTTARTGTCLVRALAGDFEVARTLIVPGYSRDEALKALSEEINGEGCTDVWDGLWDGLPVVLIEGNAWLYNVEGGLVDEAVRYGIETYREQVAEGKIASNASGSEVVDHCILNDWAWNPDDRIDGHGRRLWKSLAHTEQQQVARRIGDTLIDEVATLAA